MRRLAAKAMVGAFVAGTIGVLVAALASCGHVPPKPVPGAGCAQACARLQELGCSTSVDLCERLCSSVIDRQPGFPACVAGAATCRDADACR